MLSADFIRCLSFRKLCEELSLQAKEARSKAYHCAKSPSQNKPKCTGIKAEGQRKKML